MANVSTTLEVLATGIKRVQYASAVAHGSSVVISLPSAPQQGNTLFVVFATRIGGSTISSITEASIGSSSGGGQIADSSTAIQVGDTIDVAIKNYCSIPDDVLVERDPADSNWKRLRTSGGAILLGELWGTDVQTDSFSDTIAVNYPIASAFSVTAIEYEGLLRDIDNVMSSSIPSVGSDKNLGVSGSRVCAQTPGLFIALVSSQNGSIDHTVTIGGFDIVERLSTGSGDSEITVSVLDKFPAVVGEVSGAQVTFTAATDYIGFNTAFLPHVSSSRDRSASLDIAVAEANDLDLSLDMAIAEPTTKLSFLNMYINPTRQLAVGLDVLSAPGPAQPLRLAFFDVAVADTLQQTVDLEVYVVGETRREADLDVLINGDTDIRLLLDLDVAIIEQPPVVNVLTTPEASRYNDCRPLWCKVPKQTSRLVSMNMFITEGTPRQVAVVLDMVIDTVDPQGIADTIFASDLVIRELL